MHPGVANHARELNPNRRAAQVRGVAHQRVAVQILGKQFFAKRNALGLVHVIQAVGAPHGFGCFYDEGRGLAVVFVGVGCEPTVLGLLKRKGESVKGFARAQPHKAAQPRVDVGLVGLGVARAHPAVEAVAGNHQVGLVLQGQRLVVVHVLLKQQFHVQLFAARLQDVEQAFSPNATKAVSGGAHAAALEKHLDVVPMVEGVGNQLPGGRVGLLQVFQRFVAEHHAPAKGVVGAVAFHHGDVVLGILGFHEQGEVQTRRPTTDA